MAGRKLAELGADKEIVPDFYSVKEAVFPFIKFPESDPILGPEMKSTGEVMGTGRTFGEAYAKSQTASGIGLPRRGTALISVRERDKPGAVEMARKLVERGFDLVATRRHRQGHARQRGWSAGAVNKVREGRPHIVDMIKNDEIALIVNTTEGAPGHARLDGHPPRSREPARHVLHHSCRRRWPPAKLWIIWRTST